MLEMDDRGRLWYQEGDDRIQVTDENVARRLVAKDRARPLGKRELLYVVRYPRKDRGFPTFEQLEDYARWFRGVALAYDEPGRPPGGKP